MVVFSLAVDDVERTVTIQLDGDEFTMEFLDAPEEEVRTCDYNIIIFDVISTYQYRNFTPCYRNCLRISTIESVI